MTNWSVSPNPYRIIDAPTASDNARAPLLPQATQNARSAVARDGAQKNEHWLKRSWNKARASTTTQFLFWSTTESAPPKRVRHYPNSPNVEQFKTLPAKLVYKPEMRAPQELASSVASVPQNAAKWSYTNVVQNSEFFSDETAGRDALTNLLGTFYSDVNQTNKLKPDEMLSLTVALHTAATIHQAGETAGSPSSQLVAGSPSSQLVANGLQALTQLNLIDSILAPMPANAPVRNGPLSEREIATAAAQDMAWTIAQELAKKPNGYDILKKITPQPPPRSPECDALLNLPENRDFKDRGVNENRFVKRYDHIMEPVSIEEDRLVKLYLTAMSEKKCDLGDLGYPLEDRITTCSPESLRKRLADPKWAGVAPTLLDKGMEAIEATLRRCRQLREDGPSAEALKWIKLADPEGKNGERAAIQPHEEKFQARKLRPDLDTYRHVHTWAISFISNKIYTDLLTDEQDKPTRFALMSEEIARLSKWTDQAIKDAKPPENKTEAVQKCLRHLRSLFVAQSFKSPFGSLRTLNNLDKDTKVVGQRKLFSVSGGGIIGEARAVHEATKITAAKLREQAGLPRFDAIDPQPCQPKLQGRALKQTLVRIATLEQATQEVTNYWNTPDSNSLRIEGAPKRLDKRIAALASLCDTPTIKPDDAELRDLTEAMKEREGVMLEDILDWAEMLGAPDARPGKPLPAYLLRNGARIDNPWYEWGMHMKRAFGEQPVIRTDLAYTSKEELAKVIGKGIEATELGSAHSLQDGGSYGISTKGLTGVVTSAATGFLAQARLDLRFGKSRKAFFDFGTNGHGSDLTFGIETGIQAKAGGGIGVGVNIPVIGTKLKTNARGDLGYNGNTVSRRGIVMRFDRYDSQIPGEAKNNKKLATVAKRLIAPPTQGNDIDIKLFASGTDGESTLKNLWQMHPDLSISLIEEGGMSHGPSASVGATGLAQVGPFRLGATADLTPQATWSRQKRKEKGGTMSTGQQINGFESLLKFSPGTALLRSKIGLPVDAALTELGVPILDLASVQYDLFRRGRAKHDIVITRDGKLSKYSNRVVAYQSEKDFIKKVGPKREIYAVNKAIRYESNLTHRILDQNGKEVFSEEVERQNAFSGRINDKQLEYEEMLVWARDQYDQSKLCKEYLELSEKAVKMGDGLLALISDCEALGDKEGAAKCRLHLEMLLADDSSWEETFLLVSERETKEKKFSFGMLLGVQRVKSFTSKNIDQGH